MGDGGYRKHEVPDDYLTTWQGVVDLMSEVFDVPAGLVMRVWEEQIEVLLSSHSEGNPYKVGEKADLNTGLYCETVMASRDQLLVPNALLDTNWQDNPDVALNMISYLGVPLVTPQDEVFGTICVLDDHTREYSKSYQNLLWAFKSIIERDFALMEESEKVRKTLAELAESRKMAALGQLVAGISHEVNTPLGVSIATTSFLKGLQQQLASPGTDPTSFEQTLAKAAEATQLLERNLKRATDLMNSFQQIAVDQSNERSRYFELGSYLRDLFNTLSVELSGRQVAVRIDQNAPIHMDSFAGSLAQVITNLTQNALVHAFAGREKGSLTVSLEQQDGNAHIRFSDDGLGMSPEQVDKVFDPFFTTNLSKGSGLGAHIAYNLVTRKLNGQIRCSSVPGEGTVFDIDLPLQPGSKG